MNRIAAFSELQKIRDDNTIVVSVFSSAADWSNMSNHPLDFYSVGAMGQASSMGLGFAIGMPAYKIIVLDGDGSLMMNLGSVITMASVAPKNLIYFVCQNNDYECIGSYPIPGKSQVNFSKIARGAGFEKVYELETIDDFVAALPEIISATGPVFVTLHLEIEKRIGKKEDNLDDILALRSKQFLDKMNEITNNETRSP
jgi:phosphonopyruvate decarboxylase